MGRQQNQSFNERVQYVLVKSKSAWSPDNGKKYTILTVDGNAVVNDQFETDVRMKIHIPGLLSESLNTETYAIPTDEAYKCIIQDRPGGSGGIEYYTRGDTIPVTEIPAALAKQETATHTTLQKASAHFTPAQMPYKHTDDLVTLYADIYSRVTKSGVMQPNEALEASSRIFEAATRFGITGDSYSWMNSDDSTIDDSDDTALFA